MWDLEVMLRDSPENAVFKKVLVFAIIFDFPGVNRAQKWTKTVNWESNKCPIELKFWPQVAVKGIWRMTDF